MSRALLALTLFLGAAAQADEVGLLQIHHGHEHGKGHDSANTRLMEQRRRFDDMVTAVTTAEEGHRAPKVLALVRSLVQKNEQGEEFIDVQPLATSLMTSLRQGARGSEEFLDKSLVYTSTEMVKACESIYAIHEAFINDVFLKESPVTETIDQTLARIPLGLALGTNWALEKALPQYKKVLEGMQLLLNAANFGSQQLGLTPLAGAIKFMNQNVFPAMKSVEGLLTRGAQYSQMIKASMGEFGSNGETTYERLAKASSIVNSRTRKYEHDLLSAVNRLRAAYLRALEDGKEDIIKHPAKYNFKSTGMVVATGYGMAEGAVDGAFDYFENGFRQFVQMFLDAWSMDGRTNPKKAAVAQALFKKEAGDDKVLAKIGHEEEGTNAQEEETDNQYDQAMADMKLAEEAEKNREFDQALADSLEEEEDQGKEEAKPRYTIEGPQKPLAFLQVEKNATKKEMTTRQCMTICHRFGMSSLGAEFADISSPVVCCDKCKEIYGDV